MAKGAEIGGEITTLSGAQRSWLLSSGICLDSSAFLSPRLYIVPFSFPLLLTGNATPLRSHSALSWEMPVCSSSLASSALLSAWCFALTRVLTARLAWVLPPRIAYLPFLLSLCLLLALTHRLFEFVGSYLSNPFLKVWYYFCKKVVIQTCSSTR